VLALSFVMTHLAAPMLTPWRLAYHLLGASYNFKLVGRRLKHVYGVKNVASAAGFLLTGFAYPLALGGVTLHVKAIGRWRSSSSCFELFLRARVRPARPRRRSSRGRAHPPREPRCGLGRAAVDLLAVASIGILAAASPPDACRGHAVLAVAP